MKFDIPFKSEIYLNQVKLMTPIIYTEYYKDARKSLTVGIFSSLLGVFIILGKSQLGVLFIVLGISFIIKSLPKFKLYKTLKRTYFKITKKKLFENKSDFGKGIFEFTENSLKYIDNIETRDIKWNEFESYKIIKSNLFLILEQEKGEIMAIGKNEIGSENFEKVIIFIKTKLK